MHVPTIAGAAEDLWFTRRYYCGVQDCSVIEKDIMMMKRSAGMLMRTETRAKGLGCMRINYKLLLSSSRNGQFRLQLRTTS